MVNNDGKLASPSYKPRWVWVWSILGLSLLTGVSLFFELSRAGVLISDNIFMKGGLLLWAIGAVVFAIWTVSVILAKALKAIIAVVARVLLFLGMIEKRY